MAVIEGGVSAILAGVGAEAFKGLHATSVPLEALGHFSWGGSSGVLPVIGTLGANSEMLQFRWTHASRLAVIRRIRLSAVVSTTMFAAGVPLELDLVKASSWSGQGTGGTGVTLAATCKRRASHGSSDVAAGDLRIATTAALGAGTKTLEGNSLANVIAGGPITGSLNGQIIPIGTAIWEASVGDVDHPLVLATNEGFVIRCVNAPATGTWRLSAIVDWAEVTAY